VSPRKPLTGRHMFAILAGFFGVVIAVNLTMASYATSTFGGVVVENSYVASQEFNRWLDQAEAQDALGWSARTIRRTDGRIEVALTGPAPEAAELTATVRHPLGRQPDRLLTFEPAGGGLFVSSERLPAQRWILRLQVVGDGHVWRHEEPIP
jgi:nitrogen fixation protein FixH